jgi:hypothetical protein
VSVANAAFPAATALGVTLRLLSVSLWLSVRLLTMLLAFSLGKGGDRSHEQRGKQSKKSDEFFHSCSPNDESNLGICSVPNKELNV